MVKKIKNIIKKYDFLVFIYDKMKEFYYRYLISNKKLVAKKYEKNLGRKMNLHKPVKFNDKLQWLKFYWRDSRAYLCADKYRVREYVSHKIGNKYLIELIDVFDSVKEINIDLLPKKFVLKGTHGSSFNIICKNKNTMNWNKELKKMKRWLRTKYYLKNGEWVYKNIKPRIICEKFLSDENNKPPDDYKLFCFNGEPKFVAVDFAKYGINKDKVHGLKRNIYDLEWNFMDVQISVNNNKNIIHEKPKKLNELIQLSKILSEGFPHVRVDFYIVNGKIYFGEMTFFNTSGMGVITPEKFEIQMGNWLQLPKK